MKSMWKGHITFGLVNIPVTLYLAEKKEKISFHLIDARDQSRIHYVRVNENTGEEVPREDVSKGYEYEKNAFLMIEDKELKKIAGNHAKVIPIEGFIDQTALNPMNFYRPYYIVPEEEGKKGYVILRETLKQTGKIGISRVVIHTRQYLAALMPNQEALVLQLMHYPQEIRKTKEFDFPKQGIKQYKISKKELETAAQLIDLMTMSWKPEAYHDEYQLTLQKWVKERLRSKKPSAHMKGEVVAPSKGKVIHFVDLLKKSLEAQKRKEKKNRSAGAKRR